MTAPVFYAPEVLIAGRPVPLENVPASATDVVLGGDEGRHASKVQRIRSKERIDLVDGKGLRLICEAKGSATDGLAVDVVAVERTDPRSPKLVLVQALAKGGRDEQAIETATELGVDQVIPWQADRSVVRWNAQKTPKAMERWSKVLQAAMKQSRRATIPDLGLPVTSAELAAQIGRWCEAGSRVLICHEEATEAISSQLGGATEPTEIIIVVGPEGGVSPEELQSFTASGAQPVLLGPEVLRSSTAGPAAIIAANLMLGRW